MEFNLDLFNREKVKTLKTENELLKSEIDTLNEENHILEEKCINADKNLTEYFVKHYKGKAYKYIEYDCKFIINDIEYYAGTLDITCDISDSEGYKPDMKIYGNVNMFDNLKQITKKEFAK